MRNLSSNSQHVRLMWWWMCKKPCERRVRIARLVLARVRDSRAESISTSYVSIVTTSVCSVTSGPTSSSTERLQWELLCSETSLYNMDIKWTAGPGPAPMPYSKRAREAMGYSDNVGLRLTVRNTLAVAVSVTGLLLASEMDVVISSSPPRTAEHRFCL